MIREESPIDCGLRAQCQLWHSVYKTLRAQYTLQFLPDHFQTSPVSCGWWEKNPIDFGSWGQRSRSTLSLCVKPCGRHTDCSFSPFTFKLHMQIVEDEKKIQNTIGFSSSHHPQCKLWMMRGGKAYWLLVLGSRSRSFFALCVSNLVGTIQTLLITIYKM